MKKNRRILMTVAIVLILLIVIPLVFWVILSRGSIRSYSGENSLSEKFVMDINGAPNGFYINSKDTDNPVLLLVSSGPGTDDYFLTDKYKDMDLEDDFTVVYWDYRGCGIAYDRNVDINEITLDNLINDTHEVTGYLKERFSREKIFLMGFSGGSKIAINVAQMYPEDYYAYIGMAQCVTDSYENDTLMYGFMKKTFEANGDTRSLKKLEDSVEHIDDHVKCKNWRDYVDLVHEAGGGTIKDKSEFTGNIIPIFTCRCYTVREKLNYVPSLKMYDKAPIADEIKNYDYREEITSLDIPAYFISGEYDYNCPWELVEDYCDGLKAPDKGFYLIPDSAHSPLWENPEKTCDILKSIKEKLV